MIEALINREFKLWAYTVSHSTLILRSQLSFYDQDDYNERISYAIDIEFIAVTHIELPQKFTLKIFRILTDSIPSHLIHYKTNSNYKIFEFHTESQIGYIVAINCIIGTHSWINEDRIFNFNMTLKYDTILYTS